MKKSGANVGPFDTVHEMFTHLRNGATMATKKNRAPDNAASAGEARRADIAARAEKAASNAARLAVYAELYEAASAALRALEPLLLATEYAPQLAYAKLREVLRKAPTVPMYVEASARPKSPGFYWYEDAQGELHCLRVDASDGVASRYDGDVLVAPVPGMDWADAVDNRTGMFPGRWIARAAFAFIPME